MKESVKDKIKGLVFGAALGDAVGLATEFLTKQEANHLYGQGPIRFGSSSFSLTTPDEQGFPFHRDGHRSRWQEGDFTDDTDQLLLLVQSVLATGGSFDFRDFAARLKYWIGNGLVFPDGSTKPPYGIGRTVSLVVGSPGFTDDPHRAAWNVWENYGRQLAANGAVMRSAALGAVVFHDEAKVVKNAIDAAQVTHADPRCLVSCVIVNVLIARMLVHENTGTKPLEPRSIGDSGDYAGVKHQHQSAAPQPKHPAMNNETATRQRPRIRIDGKAKVRLATFLAGEGDTTDFRDERTLSILFDRPAAPLDPSTIKCMDDLGADASSMALLTTVVDQYKFLLQPGASAPAPWTPSSSHTFEPSSATTDFLQHACPSSLSSLNLSSGGIGYTFKALGAATYLFTRDIAAHFESPAEAFVSLITELVLEGGDADTNACVAGALLGCRVGYKELPEHWVAGLRHRTQLEQLVDQFCSLP
ncbi:hypothetical protein PhCBS80983_g02358 [Powellomyces hirtus]|uniref:ADP-ribosylglycohydrolase n=1 Tax=Powellomyces hirtus TaxID=109895 RepID=A0A507E993_9FUNG|nr:hypothetical protein PhCBS80983_g02358 [Powellomyces hirtus]